MTLLESLIINDKLTEATCKNGYTQKHAHKVIQDYLKENTAWSWGWQVYFDFDDGECYHYKLFNDFKKGSEVMNMAWKALND